MRRLFHQWWPLALSFALMIVEGPSLQAAIGRLPLRELNLAAWGLTISLSLLLESPVIMLLATSIALVRDEPSYRAMRTFVWRLSLGCTVVTALLAYTPLFRWVTEGIMRQPETIVAAAQPALRVMLFWSLAIGWRRAGQGVLVRYGHTRYVSWGTAIRLGAMAATATWVVWDGARPGVVAAATAIMAGVLAEAAANTAFLQPTLRTQMKPGVEPPPSQWAILKFHLPLATTSLLTLLAGPMEPSALARLPNPQSNLASWPVVFVLVLLIRSGCLAMQEITVAQAHEPGAGPALPRFTRYIGLLSSGALLLVGATPILILYLDHVIHMPSELWAAVRLGVLLLSPLPLLTAWAAHFRGMLMAQGRTPVIYQAMGTSLAAHGVFLFVAVLSNWIPMAVGAGGLMTSATVEYLFLRSRQRKWP